MKKGKRLAEVKGSNYHSLTRFCGQVESGSLGIPKMCILNHECYHCAFDQWMDAMEDLQISNLAQAA